MELQWTHKVSITQQVYLVKNVLEGRKEYNSSVFMSWKWGKEFWIEKNPYFLSICFRFFSFICLIDLFGDVLSCIKSCLTCCSYCKAFQRQLISMCFAPGDEHRHKKPQGFRDWVFYPNLVGTYWLGCSVGTKNTWLINTSKWGTFIQFCPRMVCFRDSELLK